MTKEYTIGIIGLGYVGLPLAIAFANHFNVVGFDINQQRVSDLNHGIDTTDEADLKLLQTTTSNRLQTCITICYGNWRRPTQVATECRRQLGEEHQGSDENACGVIVP